MKKLMIFILITISIGAMAQTIHPSHPSHERIIKLKKSGWYDEFHEIRYNDDGSIIFGKIGSYSSIMFQAENLTQLKEIFRKADIVTAFSMENKANISKVLGFVDGCEFIIHAKYHPSTKEDDEYVFSYLKLNNTFNIYKNNHKTFIEILTTERDEYYKQLAEYEKELAIYNSKMTVLDAKLDSLLNK